MCGAVHSHPALALADGICICIVYVATVLAPRYASSAEVALLNPLEAVLGPLWVYLGVGEAPSRYTLLGGALLIVSILGAPTQRFPCTDMPL